MMQSELLLPSWPTFNFPVSTADYDTQINLSMIDGRDFPYSFASPEEISTNSYAPSDDFFDLGDGTQITAAIEGPGTISSEEIEYICEWLNGESDIEKHYSSPLTIEGGEWSPCFSLESNTDMKLLLPEDEMEVDEQLTLLHLIRAYGEAMENGEKELGDVIVKSIKEKSSPMGNTMERVAYNLFRSREEQGEYLRDESSKNLLAAFKVLYQSLPCGRFAHFTANSAILESVPQDAAEIRIIDFDMGSGIQWPALIEALSRRQKGLRLTSIKSEESTSCFSRFDETKKRLLCHARQYGVRVHIEEKNIEDLESELITMNQRGQNKEFLVFNCMVGLPHMGRRMPKSHVMQFLRLANKFLVIFKGLLTLGDGEAGESLNPFSYSSYFDRLVRHYQGLFESLENNFPAYLAEARTAMESIFLVPFMCPVAWSRDWEEMVKGFDFGTGLEGRKLCEESLAEAKQMVNESENSYKVKIDKLREHEMVLQWKEAPLVRVSTWM